MYTFVPLLMTCWSQIPISLFIFNLVKLEFTFHYTTIKIAFRTTHIQLRVSQAKLKNMSFRIQLCITFSETAITVELNHLPIPLARENHTPNLCDVFTAAPLQLFFNKTPNKVVCRKTAIECCHRWLHVSITAVACRCRTRRLLDEIHDEKSSEWWYGSTLSV